MNCIGSSRPARVRPLLSGGVAAVASVFLAAALSAAAAPAVAAEPARPTTSADNRAGPVNDCARLQGELRDRCDRERGYGASSYTVAPVGNTDRPPTSPTTAPRTAP